MAPSHRRSLSTPQRLLRKSLRKSLTSEEISALKSSRAAAILVENRDDEEESDGENDNGESETAQSQEPETMARVERRASAEPAKKRQRTNGQVNGADVEIDRLEPPHQSNRDPEDEHNNGEQSNGQTLYAGDIDGEIVTETPPGSPPSPPVMIKTEQGYHEYMNTRTHTTIMEHAPLCASDFDLDEADESGRLDAQDSSSRLRNRESREGADDDDDISDFQPSFNLSAAGPSNGRRETRNRITSPMNKVRTGRISKFKEGIMSDRPSTRPLSDLIGLSHSVSGGTPRREPSIASTSRFGAPSYANRRRTIQLPRGEYGRRDQFSMTGLLKSIVTFKGFEYVKNNLVGPVRARFQDRLHNEEDGLRHKADIDDLKQKAEEVYMIRRAKEAEQLERQKKLGIEELRRHESEGLVDVERKRKFNQINGLQAEPADATDSETRAYESDASGDLPYHSFSTKLLERTLGSDNEDESDHEAPLSDTEVKKSNDLLHSVTGKAVVVPTQTPSRTPLASPRLGPAFLANDTDAESDAGCNGFFSRNRHGRSNADYAHSHDGNSRSRFNSFTRGSASGSQSMSQSFSQPQPQFNPSSSQSSQGRTFSKREIARQQRLRKRVHELEHRLLETWKELEAAGGLENVKVSSSGSVSGHSQSFGQSIDAIVAGDRDDGASTPRLDKGKQKENDPLDSNRTKFTTAFAVASRTNGSRSGDSAGEQRSVRSSMGPPPLPARMSGGRPSHETSQS